MEIFKTNRLQFAGIIDYPDITINESEVTFICGESGCGKSSLLKLFNATASPTNGSIEYCRNNIECINTISLRREVLLANQSVFLFDDTIENNFKQYYDFRELTPITTEKIKQYLNICCADFPIDTACSTMSGGERQRVFIAICLSFLPRVLMLDEPTSALDEKTSNEFMQNIKEFCMNSNIALIVISHDKALASTYADNIILLEKCCNPKVEEQSRI